MQYIDYDRKIEYSTLTKEATKIKMKEELLSEEMRLLYVALTRAREHLIITGIEKDLEKSLKEKENSLEGSRTDKINKGILKKAKSYLDWLELINIHNKEFKNCIDINYYNDLTDFNENENQESVINIQDIKVSEKVKELLNFEYYYKDLCKIESKTSVSKITKQSELKDITFKRPDFLETKTKLTNAEKGTLIHLIIQKLDYKKNYTREKIIELLEELQYKNIITKAHEEAIDIEKILRFTESKLFERISKAKNIYKEKPFYINIPANTLYETKLQDNILVQGIIDLYFIDENEKIVLVDFKTDFVEESEKELILKYKNQLGLYKQALEDGLKRKVDETYIYSLYLNKLIKIN